MKKSLDDIDQKEVFERGPETLGHASVDFDIGDLDKFKFQHGLLPAEHPVQKFVDDLTARLPAREGQPCRVFVSPDWHESNAFAMKDGTIILSAEIVRQAETEEALLGVIAHERVHVYRAHHDKQEKVRKSFSQGSSMVSDFLRMKSVERGHEYEADLRGALKDLEEAGVNPMGYKAYLEKMAQKEGRLDVAHGGSLDRALNIAGAVYYLDFASLTKGLHPINPEHEKSLRAAREKYSRSLLMYRPRTFAHSKEELADARKKQQEALTTLDARELALAVSAVYEYTAPYVDKKEESERDVKFFQSVIGRFSEALNVDGEDETQRKTKKMFGAAGLIGESLFFVDAEPANRKLFGEAFLVWQEALRTTEGLSRVGAAADAADAEGKKIFTGKILRKVVNEIIPVAVGSKVFGDFEKDEFSKEALVGFSQAWARRIADSEVKGDEEEASGKAVEIRKEILNRFSSVIKNPRAKKHFKSIFELKSSKLEKRIEALTGAAMESEFYSYGKEFVDSIKSVGQIPGAIDAYEVKFLKFLEGKSLSEIIVALSDFSSGCRESFEGGPLFSAFIPKDYKPDSRTIEIITFILDGDRIAMHLLDSCFRKLKQFKNLSEADKAVALLVFYDSTKLVFSVDPASSLKEIKSDIPDIDASYYAYADEDDDDEKSVDGFKKSDVHIADALQRRRVLLHDENYISSAVAEFDQLRDAKNLYNEFKGLNRERILFLYQRLFDGQTIEKEYGINKFAQNYEERTAKWGSSLYGDRLASTFANLVATWLSGKAFLDIVDEIEVLESSGVPVRSILEDNPGKCGGIILSLQKAIGDNSVEKISLGTLLRFGSLITNPSLRASYERYMIEVRWPKMQFKERLDLALPKGESSFIPPALAEDFLEHSVETKENVDIVKERLSLSLDALLNNGSGAVGAFALVSALRFSHRNVESFTEALLESAYDDSKLKTLVYSLARRNKTNLDNSTELLGKKEAGEFVEDGIKGISTSRYISLVRDDIKRAEEVLRAIYGLDGLGKNVVLRQLLATKDGVLSDQGRRATFWKYLFEKWVETSKGQESFALVLERVQAALATLSEWQLMYFALQNALRDKIAVPPPVGSETPWVNVQSVFEEFYGTSVQEKAAFRDKIKAQGSPVLTEKVLKYPYKYSGRYEAVGTDAISAELEKRGVISSIVDKSASKRERLSPVEFIKEIASRTGAIGVRFLQVLPQFVELDSKYEAEFASVYDSVKGQSKISAVSLLEREWPQVWDEISLIGDRIGGGSAVTVYKAQRADGRRVVLKVRNPNIEYHINETHRFAGQLLDRLAGKHGGGYAAARVALDDIKEWILKDISFEGFLEQDRAFRDKNDGYTEAGFRYSIKVPESLGPASVYFSQEEEIEGKNLTQWDQLIAEGHDMKQVTSLLIKSYVKQILDGRAHSDVHIGNFRVTPDGKVAILDRSFFLQLSGKEKSLITSLFNPFASAASREAMLLDYVEGGAAIKEKVEPVVRNIAQAMGSQDWDSVRKSIITLKQEGGHLPLNFTLLLKNFNSLRMISQKAGFENLTEAFLYHP